MVERATFSGPQKGLKPKREPPDCKQSAHNEWNIRKMLGYIRTICQFFTGSLQKENRNKGK